MTDPTPAKEKNMELNQLKAFVTVAHQGNLTQASERLFLSQPAVSAQIKAIENELGTPLFVRNSNGMSLTRRKPNPCCNTNTGWNTLPKRWPPTTPKKSASA